jgi:hypothetical protein
MLTLLKRIRWAECDPNKFDNSNVYVIIIIIIIIIIHYVFHFSHVMRRNFYPKNTNK